MTPKEAIDFINNEISIDVRDISREKVQKTIDVLQFAILALERLEERKDKSQQAEIERLQKKVDELSEVLSDTIKIRYKEAKTEAVKEVLEKLEEKIFPYGMVNDGNYGINALSIKMTIEKVKKEMGVLPNDKRRNKKGIGMLF